MKVIVLGVFDQRSIEAVRSSGSHAHPCFWRLCTPTKIIYSICDNFMYEFVRRVRRARMVCLRLTHNRDRLIRRFLWRMRRILLISHSLSATSLMAADGSLNGYHPSSSPHPPHHYPPPPFHRINLVIRRPTSPIRSLLSLALEITRWSLPTLVCSPPSSIYR